MKKIYLLLLLPLLAAFAGCGSDSPATVATAKSALNSIPQGSVPTDTIPAPTPTPTPGTTPVAGGSRPLYPYESIQGYGPADGQTGNPVRILYLGMHTDLGIDQRMRVRMDYQSSPGRFDAATGQFIGGTSNYNTVSATVTLLVNGSGVESHEICAGSGCPSSAPRISDFSTAVYNATFGRAPATLALRISSIKTDNKYLTGFCNSDFQICSTSMLTTYRQQSTYTSYYYSYGPQAAESWAADSARTFCSNAYNRCMNNIYPYAAVTEYQGWRFSLYMETDRTIRFP